MAYWLFQANPKYSRIFDAIRELEQIHWLVTRYSREIALGDGVLVWIAGKQAGVYAIAQIIAPAHFVDIPPDIDYWLMPIRARGRIYTPIRFTQKFVEAPLLKTELRHDPLLRRLQVLQAPHNTNFRVTPEEWRQVRNLQANDGSTS
jgi:predicted RNA-binding protein with PUA-like domain